ncbi:hypothetical protein GQR58_002358 [Nymphon striatum]|nr:hypothetical protein GQR58_002358 [Nymphon striatum]
MVPLIHGNTTIVFEGKPIGTPDAGTFWRVIEQHNVKSFFTAPTAFRAVKREDPKGEFVKKYDLSCLGQVFLAGERADPDTIVWAQDHLQKPIIDHWWQTELGYPGVCNPVGIELLDVKLGSPSVPLPGFAMKILDDEGNELPHGELGAIVIKLPLPPGTFPTLWNAEERFKSSYLNTFPGYYETGDAGMIDDDGYLYIMARTDDVINVAGHRLSTGAMEEVLAAHPDVAECAVIGVTDDLKGQLPMGFVCLNKGTATNEADVIKECVKLVREKIGPVAAFKLCTVVDRLPKTRSGKILRATMVKIADNAEFKMPATIDDPAILDEIKGALIPMVCLRTSGDLLIVLGLAGVAILGLLIYGTLRKRPPTVAKDRPVMFRSGLTNPVNKIDGLNVSKTLTASRSTTGEVRVSVHVKNMSDQPIGPLRCELSLSYSNFFGTPARSGNHSDGLLLGPTPTVPELSPNTALDVELAGPNHRLTVIPQQLDPHRDAVRQSIEATGDVLSFLDQDTTGAFMLMVRVGTASHSATLSSDDLRAL